MQTDKNLLYVELIIFNINLCLESFYFLLIS